MLALTHVPSPEIEQGERTHVQRVPIDFELAVRQHLDYRHALQDLGCEVRVLDVNRGLPDSVFIEDTVVVLDEVAVLTRMGAASRAAEPAGIEAIIREYREVVRIPPPGTLEGGDVLRVGRTLFVGRTGRTNAAGIQALAEHARPYGHEVRSVRMRDCLHLKTAVTALPDGRLLVHPHWLLTQDLAGFELVPVPEPFGANVALAPGGVLMAEAYPQTAQLVRDLGFSVRAVDLSEFAKAEGAITCLSILMSH
jgi:dimethylargininase